MQVVLRGRATVYEKGGDLQLSAEYLEPKGAGALQIAFEQLKAKLEAEGLFDSARKKPIPALPRCIGIVTSPQAASLRDILNILRRRHRSANLLIYPAQVQGEAAAGEVGAGIQYFNRAKNVDVIIVARGGGSAEDLAAFNHEGLARTVAGSEIPIISAVGHETDVTIIDFVADLRAPTPSAAAELVILSRQEIEEEAESLQLRLARAVRYRLLMAKQALTEAAQQGAFARMMGGRRLDLSGGEIGTKADRAASATLGTGLRRRPSLRRPAHAGRSPQRPGHPNLRRGSSGAGDSAAAAVAHRPGSASVESALSGGDSRAWIRAGLRFLRKTGEKLGAS